VWHCRRDKRFATEKMTKVRPVLGAIMEGEVSAPRPGLALRLKESAEDC